MKLKTTSASFLSLFAACSLFAADAAVQPENTVAEAPAEPVIEQYDGSWHFSVGASYRNFRSPRFKSANSGSFSNALVTLSGEVLSATDANLRKAWVERGYSTEQDGAYALTFASFEGGSVSGSGDYDTFERFAPVLAIGTDIWSDGALSLAFVANFQFFNVDTSDKASGDAIGKITADNRFVTYDSEGNTFTPNWNDTTGRGEVADASVKAVAKTKFDMQLYVFDAGLKLGYDFDSGFRTYIAAGPTLSIADMESSSYAKVSNSSGKIVSGSGRDNDVEFNFGFYVSAGAEFWFNESYGLSAEVRYDNGFGDVDTHYVSQSLDSWGGMVKLNMRF